MINKQIESVSEFFRLILFFICTPLIGLIMFIGIVSYGISLVCMFMNDYIMEKIQ